MPVDRPCCVIATGMPGAGKTTVSDLAAQRVQHTSGQTARETADLVVARVEHDAPVVEPMWNGWLRRLHAAASRPGRAEDARPPFVG